MSTSDNNVKSQAIRQVISLINGKKDPTREANSLASSATAGTLQARVQQLSSQINSRRANLVNYSYDEPAVSTARPQFTARKIEPKPGASTLEKADAFYANNPIGIPPAVDLRRDVRMVAAFEESLIARLEEKRAEIGAKLEQMLGVRAVEELSAA